MTTFTENGNTRVEKMENVRKSLQNMTDRRLDVLENKTSVYDAVISNIRSLDEIQATLNETRNIVQYYHPLGLNGTKADKTSFNGTNSNITHPAGNITVI